MSLLNYCALRGLGLELGELGELGLEIQVYLRWTPHPVIVTIRDNRDYSRVLVYSYYYRVGGPPKVYRSRFSSPTLGIRLFPSGASLVGPALNPEQEALQRLRRRKQH